MLPKNFRFLPLLLLLTIAGTVVFAQNHKWELTKHENGIRVFTRKVDGSSFKEFKAISVMNGDLEDFISVMHDVDGYTEWMADAMGARLLKRTGETQQLYYVATDTPWPASDRDAVFTMNFDYLPAQRTVYAYVKVKDNILPERPDMVRMDKADGFWKFREMDNGKVEVTLQIHPEPGGSVPGWLANSGVTSSPFNTLSALKSQVKKSRYQGQEFEFLTAGQ